MTDHTKGDPLRGALDVADSIHGKPFTLNETALVVLAAEVRRLESLQAAQGEVVAWMHENGTSFMTVRDRKKLEREGVEAYPGLTGNPLDVYTVALVRADAHPLPDGAVLEETDATRQLRAVAKPEHLAEFVKTAEFLAAHAELGDAVKLRRVEVATLCIALRAALLSSKPEGAQP